MGLAELFNFKVEDEVPWESEATEELLEDIIKKKFGRYKKEHPTMVEDIERQEKNVLKVAKEFIRMCKKIGGKPKVREYASRFFGTIDMVCYLGNVEKITSLWYDNGVISVTTEKGTGAMHLPKGLDEADIKIKGNINAENVEFSDYITRYFGIQKYVEGFTHPEKIELDIYNDHVRMVLKGY